MRKRICFSPFFCVLCAQVTIVRPTTPLQRSVPNLAHLSPKCPRSPSVIFLRKCHLPPKRTLQGDNAPGDCSSLLSSLFSLLLPPSGRGEGARKLSRTGGSPRARMLSTLIVATLSLAHLFSVMYAFSLSRLSATAPSRREPSRRRAP